MSSSPGGEDDIYVIDIPKVEILNSAEPTGKISENGIDDINQRVDVAIERDGNTQQLSMNDNNSLEQHLTISLKKLRERVIIYEFLCHLTSIYYSKWNKGFLVPSIILSSLLALLNSNIHTDECDREFNALKIFNVVSNGILTFLISFQTAFKFAEKTDYFFNLKKKFTRLHNSLNNNIIGQISNLKVDQEQMMELMKEYDSLDENILYEFPKHILKETRDNFKGYSMPTICNGINVIENDVQPRKKRKRYTIPDPRNGD